MSISGITDLPRGCLVHILSFTPLHERLHSCALVCAPWADAAAAASSSIAQANLDTRRCTALLHWVSTRAQHLTRLQLSTAAGTVNSPEAALLLPPPQALQAVQCLQVFGARLQLGTQRGGWQADSPNVLLSFPGVTELSCSSCSVQLGLHGLTALAALSRLQRLRLHIHVPATQQSARPAPEWSLPTASTWSHLTALTHLDLGDQHNITDAVLRALTRLTQLQQLMLYAAQLTAPGLGCLQSLQALHRLQLQLSPHLTFTLDHNDLRSTAVLSQLPRLQHLKLFCWRELSPALLASLVPLQHLELQAWSRRSQPEELSALLGAICQLTNLTSLALKVSVYQCDT